MGRTHVGAIITHTTDGKVDLSQRERFTPGPAPDPERILEPAVVYAPRLRRRLRIVGVIHRRHGGLAVLFSTDLDLDPVALDRYYVARFQSAFMSTVDGGASFWKLRR